MKDSVLKECLKELQEMSKEEVIKKCEELGLYDNKKKKKKYKDNDFKIVQGDE